MHYRFLRRSIIGLLLLISSFDWPMPSNVCAAEKLQFNRDIRPLLSDRCFKCHGPDKAARKAGLRLDLAEEAYAERKKSHKHAIVPGKPEESLVCRKIFSNDPDDLMPPTKSGKKLTVRPKPILTRSSAGLRWI